MPAMALRLTHVVALMALVLAAGVLGVQGIEPASAVQGTVVLVVPGMTVDVVDRLQREHDDLCWTVLPAGDGALSPFDEAIVSGQVAHGSAAALFIQPPGTEDLPLEAWRSAWRVVVAPEDGEVLPSLERFVKAQDGTRPFIAGLVLPPSQRSATPSALLEPLLVAADSLPSFRRTTFVLLGAREFPFGARVVARLDRGHGALAAPVSLTDLLEITR